MKTLIGKELRENFKIAVIGIVLFSLLVLQLGISYSRLIDAIALGKRTVGLADSHNLHPLSSVTFTMAVGSLCAIYGLLLGWLQMHHEKQRDLWGFLIHRPIERTRDFAGKV